MIITEEINSPISIDDTGLEIWVDFAKPDLEEGRGDYRYNVYFQNVINGEVIDTKAQRVLFQPVTNDNAQVNYRSLEARFTADKQFLRPYLVDEKFDWI